ncbi:hypothetical protein CTAYLR_001551 [Chrysophaeum taylorii]|uniref:Ribosome production factor 2 homolog n=1 Tax=Chrysophaeum taylorii TaxID=2483200 RepID=A0AAD7UFC2_9STRA|nr:hypothetical protein CTAYLR_001551 [Chrysophaeum taylorii]
MTKPRSATHDGRRVTARGKRFLESRAPKVHEDAKVALLLRGPRTSERATAAVQSVSQLKKPDAVYLNRRREVRPFDDASSVERLAQQYDAVLFGIASHSKKRPDNLTLGRLYDGSLLDMFEFGVLEEGGTLNKMLGTKPCLVFVGEWDADDLTKRLRNFFLDFFRGADVDKVNLAGLEHVLVVAMTREPAIRIAISPNRLRLRKSGTTIPTVNLEESGKPLVLDLRRHHSPSLDLWKTALKQPKQLKPKKRKNISTTPLRDTVGKVHVGRQDIDALQARKVKALKRSHHASEE